MAFDTDTTTKSPAPNYVPRVLGELDKKQFEAALGTQKEFLGAIEEANMAWIARAQSEIALAYELAGKLAAARSIPDAAGACQECLTRQMQMFAEDGRRVLADGEKFMRAAARRLANDSIDTSS